MFFKNAIVRIPGLSIIHGLTSSPNPDKPDYRLAHIQHQNYIKALISCGVEVTQLPPLEDYPDSCFVEDVALLTETIAVLTRPGAKPRQGEVTEIQATIQKFFPNNLTHISPPATLEAGDILKVDNHFYIGLSKRTNLAGAEQMIQSLTTNGYTASCIQLKEFLHLKTGVSYLGRGYLLVSGELINHPQFQSFKQIPLAVEEAYAANCIMVNGTVLIPQGFPKTKKAIEDHGFQTLTVDLSEFKKLDGGLSCLSLRF
ncbi:dimethylarginine dimethylaminohydrolase family protein [Legionella cardiaca]|uniref:Arginine deiminase family protein n=1 Tax=Legionella cardiaca TaxID=1071983 RepID=A0ABY8ARE5_9GAMM|nr:arginine deiminase family protein [Legionella cardiaca]WED42100.1 arginine deiminase family protein [Legionella cardiaca]